MYYTGGVAAPIDLTGQMTAGIVAGTMLLHKHGRLPEADVSANMVIARDLFNVTMTIKGVLEHPREFWHSDSFYDDRLWAVRSHSECLQTPTLHHFCRWQSVVNSSAI